MNKEAEWVVGSALDDDGNRILKVANVDSELPLKVRVGPFRYDVEPGDTIFLAKSKGVVEEMLAEANKK